MSIVQKALESARHELTTLHGLTLADGAAPQVTWQADTKAVVDQIDQALDSAKAGADINLPDPHGQIIHEIGNALGCLNAPSGLMAIVMSWGDTLPQDDVLQQLKEWNAICQP